ncbi:hypothetical protein LWI28_002495 [Acer negundo]|uniref:Germin-like protein n=1 Tax=Acer negundo TaxID=4023 RepID=A0AAD5JC69_ACENE|nr:hypothetical protein LWI28_002495 [Acer negundo]KAK4855527.1 hypothetical protein QYF36_008234 [Acer negundo]
MASTVDLNITSDFVLPSIVTGSLVDGSFFTFTGICALVSAQPPPNFKVTKASMAEFLTLNRQSVSLVVLQFPAVTTNPPHIHPRSVELLFLVDESLEVGFVDTTNKLFNQTLQAGDMFVFPKGLFHFQYNADAQKQAIAFSAFGSANAGTVSLPMTLFTTSIDDMILAKAFKTDVATIQALKAGLAPKPYSSIDLKEKERYKQLVS